MDVEDITALSVDDSNAADIIIAPSQLKQRHGYDTQIIDKLDWLVVASPSHPLAQIRSRLTYQDLISHRQIITAESLLPKSIWSSLSDSAPTYCIAHSFIKLNQCYLTDLASHFFLAT